MLKKAGASSAAEVSIADAGGFYSATNVEAALTEIGNDIAVLNTGFFVPSITAAAESGDAIVVSGLIVDGGGNGQPGVYPVLCRTLAITADKGDMTVVTGTLRKAYSPAAGVNELWLETENDGTFSVSVANDQAEITLFTATMDYGITTILKLTFTS